LNSKNEFGGKNVLPLKTSAYLSQARRATTDAATYSDYNELPARKDLDHVVIRWRPRPPVPMTP
jgi:hypothetical protein